ncbi:site-specific integrase [Haloferax mediterranei ATCC 33500]|uniref:Integrase n=1 Tax=Haloferax mediterranei (strain ATCC 33500 / DSM 1411 / JCM 8866 / NBRC 14739 / NCIMB 2177 / R-4) TaxID=523841 RepID=I3R446_HALMT|nr:site-specific integrase [Haloferax mediterranei]AFK19006.1 putative phage integrase [Haloferax mediterranei ATCC 33500]AHZ21638.1 integrase [Haloferax mediterranei ATCC 33500]EMA03554.1 putative phage integrase [Haloferax mediterranei ATCC 33500]MDX5989098.1 site-specific integrase [Haloferax mediterranei ATCC 33500]QCQ75484.1 site-specific integrase [Haloferax mediterranei ATCC 33500]
MQARPYPSKSGKRLWLSRAEQEKLLSLVEDEYPRRRIALDLALHGLRSDEVRNVEPRHFEPLDDQGKWRLTVPDGKSGARDTPVSQSLRERVKYLKSAARMRADEPIIDVSTRSLRDWIVEARGKLADDLDDDRWHDLGMHDLRRTWATDTFYSLAFEGVPIAEELTMAWGGWAMTDSGRETFRRNYLGPVPDHITSKAMAHLSIS